MAKGNFVLGNDLAFLAQMVTFDTNIGGYAAILGITTDQVIGHKADTAYLNYVLKSLGLMQNAAQQWTAWKNLLRAGGTPPAAGAPVLPVFPDAVPAVALGLETRFRALAKQAKASINYNEAIGKALGIEGAQQSPPDYTTLQPDIDATINGAHVDIGWGWGGYVNYLDLCEIQVDRGDGRGFTLLAIDSTPGYTDTTPLPATPAKWIYKAIYRVDDAQVGLWSNPVSIIVQA
jgi:hypothetical protein